MHIATGTGDFIYINILHKEGENPMTLLHQCSECFLGSHKGLLEVSRALKQREQPFLSRGEGKLHLARLDFLLSELLSPLHKILLANISCRVFF